MARSLGGIEVHVVAAASSAGHGQGPTHLGDAVREFMRRQFDVDPEALVHPGADEALVIEASTALAAQRLLPAVVVSPPSALLENNLARKGVWAVDPDRTQQEFRFQTRDVVGTLLVDYTLGQLSVADMRLVAWLLGRWSDDEDDITFTFRGCTREMGLTWSGRRAADLRRQLHRIHRTQFTGRVFSGVTGKRQELLFGIVDVVEINDRADSLDEATVNDATVRATLSRFISDNLRAGQFVRLRWPILNGLRSDLAQRLYAFLESQKGFRRDGKHVYEITIDEQLQASLGSGDRLRRFRVKLAAAGEQICSGDARYEAISIRSGKARGVYVLSVHRTG